MDAFQLWCWIRLLTVPWTARRSNQSILKEINPGCSLKGLMLKLKVQYFDHLIQRTDSFEKTLMLGKIEAGGKGDDRGWDCWMASPTQWTWVWAGSGNWCWTGRPGMLQLMGLQRVGHDWATELNWTDVCNIGVPQYVRQMLTNMKGEINSNTIIVGTFNTELILMDISTKQKISKETQTLRKQWTN